MHCKVLINGIQPAAKRLPWLVAAFVCHPGRQLQVMGSALRKTNILQKALTGNYFAHILGIKHKTTLYQSATLKKNKGLYGN